MLHLPLNHGISHLIPGLFKLRTEQTASNNDSLDRKVDEKFLHGKNYFLSLIEYTSYIKN